MLDEGVTVMRVVVCPLLHRYVVPPEAVRAWELPMQMVVFGLAEAVGLGFMVTVVNAVSEQLPLVTMTE